MKIRYILLSLFLLIFGLFIFAYLDYADDIDQAYDRLKSDETKIFNSKNAGRVQYKIQEGDYTPVLIVHGITGGYDQAINTGKNLIDENRELIGVSRFGYLNSDLPEDSSPRNQARVYKNLLTQLKIDEVYVLATSAGGTPAINFALNYPEKTKGVILIGSAVPNEQNVEEINYPPSFVYNDFIFWTLTHKIEGTLLDMFGINSDTYKNATADEKENLQEVFRTLLPIEPRREGIFNDERVTNIDAVKNYDKYRVDSMKIPFLVMHCKNDPMAKFENVEKFVKRIDSVELISYENGGHLLFGHEDEMKQEIQDFLINNE